MEILPMDTPITTDLFASDRDGYTLQSVTFNFDLINTNSPGVPTSQFGVIVKGHCPHGETFNGFIPLSKEAMNEENAFTELMRLIDFGAESLMEDGCTRHDKKDE